MRDSIRFLATLVVLGAILAVAAAQDRSGSFAECTSSWSDSAAVDANDPASGDVFFMSYSAVITCTLFSRTATNQPSNGGPSDFTITFPEGSYLSGQEVVLGSSSFTFKISAPAPGGDDQGLLSVIPNPGPTVVFTLDVFFAKTPFPASTLLCTSNIANFPTVVRTTPGPTGGNDDEVECTITSLDSSGPIRTGASVWNVLHTQLGLTHGSVTGLDSDDNGFTWTFTFSGASAADFDDMDDPIVIQVTVSSTPITYDPSFPSGHLLIVGEPDFSTSALTCASTLTPETHVRLGSTDMDCVLTVRNSGNAIIYALSTDFSQVAEPGEIVGWPDGGGAGTPIRSTTFDFSLQAPEASLTFEGGITVFNLIDSSGLTFVVFFVGNPDAGTTVECESSLTPSHVVRYDSTDTVCTLTPMEDGDHIRAVASDFDYSALQGGSVSSPLQVVDNGMTFVFTYTAPSQGVSDTDVVQSSIVPGTGPVFSAGSFTLSLADVPDTASTMECTSPISSSPLVARVSTDTTQCTITPRTTTGPSTSEPRKGAADDFDVTTDLGGAAVPSSVTSLETDNGGSTFTFSYQSPADLSGGNVDHIRATVNAASFADVEVELVGVPTANSMFSCPTPEDPDTSLRFEQTVTCQLVPKDGSDPPQVIQADITDFGITTSTGSTWDNPTTTDGSLWFLDFHAATNFGQTPVASITVKREGVEVDGGHVDFDLTQVPTYIELSCVAGLDAANDIARRGSSDTMCTVTGYDGDSSSNPGNPVKILADDVTIDAGTGGAVVGYSTANGGLSWTFSYDAPTTGDEVDITASGAMAADAVFTLHLAGIPTIDSTVACTTANDPSTSLVYGATASCTLTPMDGPASPIKAIPSDFAISSDNGVVDNFATSDGGQSWTFDYTAPGASPTPTPASTTTLAVELSNVDISGSEVVFDLATSPPPVAFLSCDSGNVPDNAVRYGETISCTIYSSDPGATMSPDPDVKTLADDHVITIRELGGGMVPTLSTADGGVTYTFVYTAPAAGGSAPTTDQISVTTGGTSTKSFNVQLVGTPGPESSITCTGFFNPTAPEAARFSPNEGNVMDCVLTSANSDGPVKALAADFVPSATQGTVSAHTTSNQGSTFEFQYTAPTLPAGAVDYTDEVTSTVGGSSINTDFEVALVVVPDATSTISCDVPDPATLRVGTSTTCTITPMVTGDSNPVSALASAFTPTATTGSTSPINENAGTALTFTYTAPAAGDTVDVGATLPSTPVTIQLLGDPDGTTVLTCDSGLDAPEEHKVRLGASLACTLKPKQSGAEVAAAEDDFVISTTHGATIANMATADSGKTWTFDYVAPDPVPDSTHSDTISVVVRGHALDQGGLDVDLAGTPTDASTVACTTSIAGDVERIGEQVPCVITVRDATNAPVKAFLSDFVLFAEDDAAGSGAAFAAANVIINKDTTDGGFEISFTFDTAPLSVTENDALVGGDLSPSGRVSFGISLVASPDATSGVSCDSGNDPSDVVLLNSDLSCTIHPRVAGADVLALPSDFAVVSQSTGTSAGFSALTAQDDKIVFTFRPSDSAVDADEVHVSVGGDALASNAANPDQASPFAFHVAQLPTTLSTITCVGLDPADYVRFSGTVTCTIAAFSGANPIKALAAHFGLVETAGLGAAVNPIASVTGTDEHHLFEATFSAPSQAAAGGATTVTYDLSLTAGSVPAGSDSLTLVGQPTGGTLTCDTGNDPSDYIRRNSFTTTCSIAVSGGNGKAVPGDFDLTSTGVFDAKPDEAAGAISASATTSDSGETWTWTLTAPFNSELDLSQLVVEASLSFSPFTPIEPSDGVVLTVIDMPIADFVLTCESELEPNNVVRVGGTVSCEIDISPSIAVPADFEVTVSHDGAFMADMTLVNSGQQLTFDVDAPTGVSPDNFDVTVMVNSGYTPDAPDPQTVNILLAQEPDTTSTMACTAPLSSAPVTVRYFDDAATNDDLVTCVITPQRGSNPVVRAVTADFEDVTFLVSTASAAMGSSFGSLTTAVFDSSAGAAGTEFTFVYEAGSEDANVLDVDLAVNIGGLPINGGATPVILTKVPDATSDLTCDEVVVRSGTTGAATCTLTPGGGLRAVASDFTFGTDNGAVSASLTPVDSGSSFTFAFDATPISGDEATITATAGGQALEDFVIGIAGVPTTASVISCVSLTTGIAATRHSSVDDLICTIEAKDAGGSIRSLSTDFVVTTISDGVVEASGDWYSPDNGKHWEIGYTAPASGTADLVSAKLSAGTNQFLQGNPVEISLVGTPDATSTVSCDSGLSPQTSVRYGGNAVNCKISAKDGGAPIRALARDFVVALTGNDPADAATYGSVGSLTSSDDGVSFDFVYTSPASETGSLSPSDEVELTVTLNEDLSPDGGSGITPSAVTFDLATEQTAGADSTLDCMPDNPEFAAEYTSSGRLFARRPSGVISCTISVLANTKAVADDFDLSTTLGTATLSALTTTDGGATFEFDYTTPAEGNIDMIKILALDAAGAPVNPDGDAGTEDDAEIDGAPVDIFLLGVPVASESTVQCKSVLEPNRSVRRGTSTTKCTVTGRDATGAHIRTSLSDYSFLKAGWSEPCTGTDGSDFINKNTQVTSDDDGLTWEWDLHLCLASGPSYPIAVFVGASNRIPGLLPDDLTTVANYDVTVVDIPSGDSTLNCVSANAGAPANAPHAALYGSTDTVCTIVAKDGPLSSDIIKAVASDFDVSDPITGPITLTPIDNGASFQFTWTAPAAGSSPLVLDVDITATTSDSGEGLDGSVLTMYLVLDAVQADTYVECFSEVDDHPTAVRYGSDTTTCKITVRDGSALDRDDPDGRARALVSDFSISVLEGAVGGTLAALASSDNGLTFDFDYEAPALTNPAQDVASIVVQRSADASHIQGSAVALDLIGNPDATTSLSCDSNTIPSDLVDRDSTTATCTVEPSQLVSGVAVPIKAVPADFNFDPQLTLGDDVASNSFVLDFTPPATGSSYDVVVTRSVANGQVTPSFVTLIIGCGQPTAATIDCGGGNDPASVVDAGSAFTCTLRGFDDEGKACRTPFSAYALSVDSDASLDTSSASSSDDYLTWIVPGTAATGEGSTFQVTANFASDSSSVGSTSPFSLQVRSTPTAGGSSVSCYTINEPDHVARLMPASGLCNPGAKVSVANAFGQVSPKEGFPLYDDDLMVSFNLNLDPFEGDKTVMSRKDLDDNGWELVVRASTIDLDLVADDVVDRTVVGPPNALKFDTEMSVTLIFAVDTIFLFVDGQGVVASGTPLDTGNENFIIGTGTNVMTSLVLESQCIDNFDTVAWCEIQTDAPALVEDVDVVFLGDLGVSTAPVRLPDGSILFMLLSPATGDSLDVQVSIGGTEVTSSPATILYAGHPDLTTDFECASTTAGNPNAVAYDSTDTTCTVTPKADNIEIRALAADFVASSDVGSVADPPGLVSSGDPTDKTFTFTYNAPPAPASSSDVPPTELTITVATNGEDFGSYEADLVGTPDATSDFDCTAPGDIARYGSDTSCTVTGKLFDVPIKTLAADWSPSTGGAGTFGALSTTSSGFDYDLTYTAPLASSAIDTATLSVAPSPDLVELNLVGTPDASSVLEFTSEFAGIGRPHTVRLSTTSASCTVRPRQAAAPSDDLEALPDDFGVSAERTTLDLLPIGSEPETGTFFVYQYNAPTTGGDDAVTVVLTDGNIELPASPIEITLVDFPTAASSFDCETSVEDPANYVRVGDVVTCTIDVDLPAGSAAALPVDFDVVPSTNVGTISETASADTYTFDYTVPSGVDEDTITVALADDGTLIVPNEGFTFLIGTLPSKDTTTMVCSNPGLEPNTAVRIGEVTSDLCQITPADRSATEDFTVSNDALDGDGTLSTDDLGFTFSYDLDLTATTADGSLQVIGTAPDGSLGTFPFTMVAHPTSDGSVLTCTETAVPYGGSTTCTITSDVNAVASDFAASYTTEASATISNPSGDFKTFEFTYTAPAYAPGVVSDDVNVVLTASGGALDTSPLTIDLLADADANSLLTCTSALEALYGNADEVRRGSQDTTCTIDARAMIGGSVRDEIKSAVTDFDITATVGTIENVQTDNGGDTYTFEYHAPASSSPGDTVDISVKLPGMADADVDGSVATFEIVGFVQITVHPLNDDPNVDSYKAGADFGQHLTAQILLPDNSVATDDSASVLTVTINTYNGGDPTGTNLVDAGTTDLAATTGTSSVTVTAGEATFTGIGLDLAGEYTVTVSDGIDSDTSEPFTITHGDADSLEFDVQPGDGTGGSLLSVQPEVIVIDLYGNLVDTWDDASANFPDPAPTISLALVCDGSCAIGQDLSGTTARNAPSGRSNFDDLYVNPVGLGYTLEASRAGVVEATSDTFDVTVGPIDSVSFEVEPPSTVPAGAVIIDESADPDAYVTVALLDAGGNVVDTDSTSQIVMTLHNSGGSPTAFRPGSTATVTVTAGVAEFSNLAINPKAEGYTMTAAVSPSGPSVTSAAFDVVFGPIETIVFSGIDPATIAGGGGIIAAGDHIGFDAFLHDLGGNVITDHGLVTMTITLEGGPPDAGFTANPADTFTKTVVSGSASWTTLAVVTVGTGYRLKATATPSDAEPVEAYVLGVETFEVEPSGAAELVFVTQPGSHEDPTIEVTNNPLTIQPVVEAQDAFGNMVVLAGTVTLTINDGPAGASLLGTTSRTFNMAGQAVFTDIAVDTEGAYHLLASSTLMGEAAVSAVSDEFEVTVKVPDMPENLRVVDVGPTFIEIAWDLSPSDGGAPITAHVLTLQVGGPDPTPSERTIGAAATSYVIDGLEIGALYTFALTAENFKGRSDPAGPIAQATIFFDGIVMSHFFTNPGTGDENTINTNEGTELYADLLRIDWPVTYLWQQVDDADTSGTTMVDPSTDLSTEDDKRTYTIHPWTLEAGVYKYQCTATVNVLGHVQQTRTILFVVNDSPDIGVLSVDATTGLHGESAFTFTATGFDDADGPLEYKLVYWRAAGGEDGDDDDDIEPSMVVLREFSTLPLESSPRPLPPGSVRVAVIVRDALGAQTPPVMIDIDDDGFGYISYASYDTDDVIVVETPMDGVQAFLDENLAASMDLASLSESDALAMMTVLLDCLSFMEWRVFEPPEELAIESIVANIIDQLGAMVSANAPFTSQMADLYVSVLERFAVLDRVRLDVDYDNTAIRAFVLDALAQVVSETEADMTRHDWVTTRAATILSNTVLTYQDLLGAAPEIPAGLAEATGKAHTAILSSLASLLTPLGAPVSLVTDTIQASAQDSRFMLGVFAPPGDNGWIEFYDGSFDLDDGPFTLVVATSLNDHFANSDANNVEALSVTFMFSVVIFDGSGAEIAVAGLNPPATISANYVSEEKMLELCELSGVSDLPFECDALCLDPLGDVVFCSTLVPGECEVAVPAPGCFANELDVPCLSDSPPVGCTQVCDLPTTAPSWCGTVDDPCRFPPATGRPYWCDIEPCAWAESFPHVHPDCPVATDPGDGMMGGGGGGGDGMSDMGEDCSSPGPSASLIETVDAGDSPATAVKSGLVLSCGTPITSIEGTIDSFDVDMYVIMVDDPLAFSATTVGTESPDTRLWLFEEDGTLVVYNDDDLEGGLQSTITDPRVYPHPSVVSPTARELVAGSTYILAVGRYLSDPLDASGALLHGLAWDDLYGPSDGVGPLASFDTSPTFGGSYTVLLEGAYAAFVENRCEFPRPPAECFGGSVTSDMVIRFDSGDGWQVDDATVILTTYGSVFYTSHNSDFVTTTSDDVCNYVVCEDFGVDAESCVADPCCGFCRDTFECVPALEDGTGPETGTCDVWHFDTCEVDSVCPAPGFGM